MKRGFAQSGPGGHPIDAVCAGLAAPLTDRERALNDRTRRLLARATRESAAARLARLVCTCGRGRGDCVCGFRARPATILPAG